MNARKWGVSEDKQVPEGNSREGCDEEKLGQDKDFKKKAFNSKETTFRKKADARENFPTKCTSAVTHFPPNVWSVYLERAPRKWGIG